VLIADHQPLRLEPGEMHRLQFGLDRPAQVGYEVLVVSGPAPDYCVTQRNTPPNPSFPNPCQAGYQAANGSSLPAGGYELVIRCPDNGVVCEASFSLWYEPT